MRHKCPIRSVALAHTRAVPRHRPNAPADVCTPRTPGAGYVRTRAQPYASFFHQRLDELRELDLSDAFVATAKQLTPLVQTLPLLLFHKQAVLELLLVALRQPETLALQSLLSLVAALARDLQAEVYPMFPAILGCLLDILDPRDSDGLEVGPGRPARLLQSQATRFSPVYPHHTATRRVREPSRSRPFSPRCLPCSSTSSSRSSPTWTKPLRSTRLCSGAPGQSLTSSSSLPRASPTYSGGCATTKHRP